MPYHSPEWKNHMEKIDIRIENLERMERELWRRVDDIEGREEDVEVKLGMRSRISRIYKPRFIKKQVNDIERRVKRMRRPGSDRIGKRRTMMQRQIKDVVKKADEVVREEPFTVGEIGPGDEKKIQKERRDILKREISNVIKKHKGAEEEEKRGIPKEIKQLKILTGEEASDARILFEFLLRTGSASMDEAVNELDVDRETVNSWMDDLKASGLIEVNEFAGRTVMKLRNIPIAVSEKKKGDRLN